MQKICIKCELLKDITLFSKGIRHKDGLYPYCKKCEQLNNQKYYKENKDKELLRVKQYQSENKETVRKTRQKRIDKTRIYNRNYKRERSKVDPLYKLKGNLRRSISHAFKGIRKSKKSIELLGCSFEHAKAYLESQFQPGMTWENYGKWHIDHIIPLNSAKTIEEVEKLWYYSNLQPLWAEDNLKKGKALDWQPNL